MSSRWFWRFCLTVVIAIAVLLKLSRFIAGGTRQSKQMASQQGGLQHSYIEQIFSGIGVLFLGIIVIFTGIQAERLHAVAIADPAIAPGARTYSAIAVVFNKRVTGHLDLTLDLRSHDTPTGSGQITLFGRLHQPSFDTTITPLRCYLFTYGALRLNLASTMDATFNTPPGPGIHPPPAVTLTHMSSSRNFAAYSLVGYVTEDPMYFSFTGSVTGPLYATGSGQMAGTAGPIGGVNILDVPQTQAGSSLSSLFTQESYSNAITIDEIIETAWTNNAGTLNADTSLISADSGFSNPRRLYLTWRGNQLAYQSQEWELENRVQHEAIQSQDFLAGVFAAVAATAALMCMALAGRIISALLMRFL